MEATIIRQWFPKGSCPKVKSYPGRKSVAYSGFVTYGSGELFVAKPSWFNYETTIASIREFIAEQVWRVTRREKTHNRYWKNLDVLTTTLDDWFSTFTKPNKKLASLCSFAW